MKKLLVLLTVLMFTTSASALTQAQLEDFKQSYNNQTDQVPGFAGSIVGGETVNVEINRTNSTETVGAKMDGVEIGEIQDEGYENNTMVVETDGDTFETILSSNAPFDQIQTELDENDIDYSSETVGGSVKLTVFKGLKGVADTLGLQF